MLGYLHEFYFKDLPRKHEIEKIAGDYGIKVEEGVHGHNLNSGIKLYFEEVYSVLSEFPGNCSALVLHRIQGMYYDLENRKKVFNCAIEICKSLGYAALFVSGTWDSEFRTEVQDLGFTLLIDNLVNIHNEHRNFYAVKYIEQ